MRWSLDGSVRRPRPTLVVGGSPLRLFRLAPEGARLLDRITAGEEVDPAPAEARLVDRLVEAGALHPVAGSHPPPGWSTPAASDVTVVVPVRDRVALLDRLLSSLADAAAARPDERPARVVVVDDGSVDAAAHAEVARRHGARLVRRATSGGPGPARDAGIDVAATPLVAVLDSDCTVTAGWLTPALEHLADHRVGAVAARVRSRPGPGLLARYDAVRSPLDLGPSPGRVAPRTRISYVPAAGLVLRVAAHRAVGGFDPALRTGEDVDLVWRLVGAGWRVRYEPGATVVHDVRSGPCRWLAQRVGYGRSAAALDARHPGQVAPVSCSAWSAAAWASAAAGHPVVGGALALGSAAALPRRLGDLPPGEAVRLAVEGHRGAGALLGRAVVRAWWPVAVVAATRSRWARRILVASAASVVVRAARAAPAAEWASPLDRARFAGLVLVDDAAYGAGLWWGCWQERSLRALLPDLQGWPRRSDRR